MQNFNLNIFLWQILIVESDTIAIDLDDTIADSSAIALEIIRKEYVPDASFEKWKYYSIEKSFGIAEVHARSICSRAWENPERIKLVDPSIPKVVDALRKTHNIYIVTATIGEESSFIPWLERKHVSFDKVLHVSHMAEKALLNKKHGIGFYIDDSQLVAESVAAAGRVALLLRKSWNADFFDSDRNKSIVKVRNWKEIGDFFTD